MTSHMTSDGPGHGGCHIRGAGLSDPPDPPCISHLDAIALCITPWLYGHGGVEEALSAQGLEEVLSAWDPDPKCSRGWTRAPVLGREQTLQMGLPPHSVLSL